MPRNRRDIFDLSERMMGMDDAMWARHANPLSVYSRFSILPLMTLSILSRVWLGWGGIASNWSGSALDMVEPTSLRNTVQHKQLGVLRDIW